MGGFHIVGPRSLKKHNKQENSMVKIKEMEQFYNQDLPMYVCAVRFDLRDLQKLGTDIARFREELLEQWTRFQKWPDILRPNPETYRQIIELVNNA